MVPVSGSSGNLDTDLKDGAEGTEQQGNHSQNIMFKRTRKILMKDGVDFSRRK